MVLTDGAMQPANDWQAATAGVALATERMQPREAYCNAGHFKGANLSMQNDRGVERGKRGATAEAKRWCPTRSTRLSR